MLYVELESLLVRTPPNPRGPSGFHALLAIAERGTPFTAVGGRAFISVPAQSGGHLTFSIRSRAFRQFFFDQCFSLYDTIPTTHAFNAILHHLEAQAASDPHRCHLPPRLPQRRPLPRRLSRPLPHARKNPPRPRQPRRPVRRNHPRGLDRNLPRRRPLRNLLLHPPTPRPRTAQRPAIPSNPRHPPLHP